MRGTPQSDRSEKKTEGRWSRAGLIGPVLLGSLGFATLTLIVRILGPGI